jgi:hypothetical protein
MKKSLFAGALFLAAAGLPVFAQGLYFDIGLGVGDGKTELNGVSLGIEGDGLVEVAVDVGLKAGYGPFGTTPLYVTAEIGGMGHRVSDAHDYIQFNSYIIGIGVIYYPLPLIQVGFSAGPSDVSNVTNLSDEPYKSQGGYAWNISAAVDLGSGKSGCLIGIKYFIAHNTLETTNAYETSSMIGVFVRYAHRTKIAPSS